jgi:hypothetical protein
MTIGAVGRSVGTTARRNVFLFMVGWEAGLRYKIGWRTRPTIWYQMRDPSAMRSSINATIVTIPRLIRNGAPEG